MTKAFGAIVHNLSYLCPNIATPAQTSYTDEIKCQKGECGTSSFFKTRNPLFSIGLSLNLLLSQESQYFPL